MVFESMYQKMTIRVPDDLRDTIQKNADETSMTMSDYAREMIERGLESGPRIAELESKLSFVIHALDEVMRMHRESDEQKSEIARDCISVLEGGVSEVRVKWVLRALKFITKDQVGPFLNPPCEPTFMELMKMYPSTKPDKAEAAIESE